MGMTGTVWRVTPADVRRLERASQREVSDFLFGAPSGPVRAKGLRGWFNRFSPITIESYEDYLDAPRGPGGARAELDVDKAWHGLHFLFTGTAEGGDEPACFLTEGGSILGEDPGVEQLELRLEPVPVAVPGDERLVGKRRLRVLVEVLHVRMGRGAVEVEVILLDVLSVVPLAVGQAEEALLQDRVGPVPEGEPEAQ